MSHYVISYDLHKARNYQPVWNELQRWGAVRLLESLWVVSRPEGPGALRDALKSVIDNDDSVAVLELKTGSEWASLRAREAGVDWLSRNIKRY